LPPLPISKLIDHIDHIVKVAGIDHVGIGADFDGANDMPEGAQDVSMLPNITYELLKRGYSERDIQKDTRREFPASVCGSGTRRAQISKSISGDGSLEKHRINKIRVRFADLPMSSCQKKEHGALRPCSSRKEESFN
jgi:hypothetical protein